MTPVECNSSAASTSSAGSSMTLLQHTTCHKYIHTRQQTVCSLTQYHLHLQLGDWAQSTADKQNDVNLSKLKVGIKDKELRDNLSFKWEDCHVWGKVKNVSHSFQKSSYGEGGCCAGLGAVLGILIPQPTATVMQPA